MRSNPPLILVFSTARRLQYFRRTLSSLVLRNPDLCEFIHRVYILDDRSSMEDREAMRLMVGRIFGPALVHLITFDDESDWGYVRKLNFLRSLTVNGAYTLFLEDDWECTEALDLKSHLQLLHESKVDLVTFSENLSIQPETERESQLVDNLYWQNPWPQSFRHTEGISDTGWIVWTDISIRHFSLNPCLAKARVWSENEFVLEQGYEFKFADANNFLQYFTLNPKFVHIGQQSLERRHSG